jgi:predicted NAD/FAD-dependent oxidoreductase
MATPRKLRTNTDFLVIGGGMAGISALAETRRLGTSAICLEVRPKTGGRVRTVRNRRTANYPIELGAEFVHGSVMKQLFGRRRGGDALRRARSASRRTCPTRPHVRPGDDINPQLFFAGDYVTRHPGSAHSAYQSGIDAAHRAVTRRETRAGESGKSQDLHF